MNFYYISIILIVMSNVLYHIFQKLISETVNPITSLIVTYATALVICIIVFFIYPSKQNFIQSFKDVNWASFALGLSIIGLEIGFLLAYRAGWNVSLAALLSNVLIGILLVPIGLIFFKEHISLTNAVGILLSIAGLILIFKK